MRLRIYSIGLAVYVEPSSFGLCEPVIMDCRDATEVLDKIGDLRNLFRAAGIKYSIGVYDNQHCGYSEVEHG